MKRNLLALAIPALLVAGAANASIEIYNKDGNKLSINGQAEVVNYLGERAKTEKEGDDSSARFGFTGETQVTDSITGYGRAEWNLKTKTDSNVETRYAFAGLDFGTAGAVDYGKNDGALKAITSYTDVLPKFGGEANDFLLGDRTESVLTYRNAKLVDGLSFAVQYADDASVSDVSRSNRGEAYGLNAQYAIADTGVTVGAAYAQTAKTGVDKDKSTAYIFGINYDANDLYLAAIYGNQTDKDTAGKDKTKDKTKGIELVAQYGIALDVGTVKPSLAYVQNTTKYNDGSKEKNAKYVSVGATYDFNKNLSFAADYKINLLKESDQSAQGYKNTLGLGLTYSF